MLHGYVSCANIAAGQLPHDCDGSAPHRLLVCVIKSHTCAAVYEELERGANARQPAPTGFAYVAVERGPHPSTVLGVP
jgi:hypothetical protein